VANGQVTRETLDLITALRPFTSERGQRLIDTLIEITQAGTMTESLEITTMTERAQGLLAERLDSAVSLSLILAASWFGKKLEAFIAERTDRLEG
jgi:limonene-1,2-epoxide hydrolase